MNKKLIPQLIYIYIYICCHKPHWNWYTTNLINSKSHSFFLMKAEIWSEPNCRICTPSKTYQLLHKLPSWSNGVVLLFKWFYLRTRPLSVMFVHSKMLVPHTYECLCNKYYAKWYKQYLNVFNTIYTYFHKLWNWIFSIICSCVFRFVQYFNMWVNALCVKMKDKKVLKIFVLYAHSCYKWLLHYKH
jgi:hypothetical protein